MPIEVLNEIFDDEVEDECKVTIGEWVGGDFDPEAFDLEGAARAIEKMKWK